MIEAERRSASILDCGLPEVADRLVGAARAAIDIQEVGVYRLIRFIGEGGMGVVYLAERKDAGNQVAIKFLLHAGLSPARRERFAREIKLLGKLRHPAIARLYDAGALEDGTPWFVMEYVEGKRLIEYCREQAKPSGELIELFRRVCEAVQYAHGQEIIHRDLKPSNIMVDEQGTPRLLDFGVAKELHSLEEDSGANAGGPAADDAGVRGAGMGRARNRCGVYRRLFAGRHSVSDACGAITSKEFARGREKAFGQQHTSFRLE